MEPNKVEATPTRLTSTAGIKVGQILRCHNVNHKPGGGLVEVTRVGDFGSIVYKHLETGPRKVGSTGGSTYPDFSLVEQDFKVGDRVRINWPPSKHHGKEGYLKERSNLGPRSWRVYCDGPVIANAFQYEICFETELVLLSAAPKPVKSVLAAPEPPKVPAEIEFGKLYTIHRPGLADHGRTVVTSVCCNGSTRCATATPLIGGPLVNTLVRAAELRECAQGNGLVQPNPVPEVSPNPFKVGDELIYARRGMPNKHGTRITVTKVDKTYVWFNCPHEGRPCHHDWECFDRVPAAPAPFVSDLKKYDLVRHNVGYYAGQEGPVLTLPTGPNELFDVLLKDGVCLCRRSEVIRLGALDPVAVRLIEHEVKTSAESATGGYSYKAALQTRASDYRKGWNACLKEVERRRDLIGGAAQKAREELGGPLPGKMRE